MSANGQTLPKPVSGMTRFIRSLGLLKESPIAMVGSYGAFSS